MLWRRYGALIVGVALLIVAGTAAKVGWDHWTQQARAAEAARFAAAQAALQAGNQAEAASQFAALAAEGKTGFAALARLKEAEAKLGQKDSAGALAALDGLGRRRATTRSCASSARSWRSSSSWTRAIPATLRQQLEPLAAAGAPWRNRARELQALVAIRAGELDQARSILGELSTEVGVPPSQQRRAAELLQAIGGAPVQASS